MEDLSQEVVKLSKINSAGLINLRISNLWEEVNKTAISGNYSRWNLILDRVWMELIGDVQKTSEKREEFNKLDKDVSEKLVNLKTKEGFSKFTKDDKINMYNTYKFLMKKEDFLRTLMNKQGKGTAYDEDDDFE